MKTTIEKKFHPRVNGTLQFVADYEDFEKVNIGDCLGVLAQGKGNEFSAYFEGRKANKRCQIIFLQQESFVDDGPIRNQNISKVVQYTLPLTGKIRLDDFYKGKIKEYPVK